MAVIEDKYFDLKKLLITCFVLIAVPFLFAGIIYGIMYLCARETPIANLYTSFGFGLLLGSLYHLICIITGILKEPFIYLAGKTKDFFDDLRISVKMAFKYLFKDLRIEDLECFIYVLIMLATLVSGIVCICLGINYYFR